LIKVGRAHNRRGDRLAVKQSGKGHGGVARVVLPGRGIERLQDAQPPFAYVLLYGVAGAAPAFPEIGRPAVLAAEEAGG